MSRGQVLERIRAALAAGGPASRAHGSAGGFGPPGALPDLPRPLEPADSVSLFLEQASQLGMIVEVAPSMHEAAVRAAAWCVRRAARRVAAWSTAELKPVVERVRGEGIEILPPGVPLNALAAAEVGITGAEWGIAETATLVLPADADRPRLTSLLPPAHLAIVRADRILPDLPALVARVGTLPSALTLVTGPSRSADIGFVPVLGAHGPMEVTVILVTASREDEERR